MLSARRALVSTLAVGALASVPLAAPAGAATVLSRSDASAFTVAVAANGQDSGTVEATFDGSRETVTGQSSPALGLLGGQGFANFGVASQQASAGDGFSRACAGLAGSDGSVVQIGGSTCLTPGEEVSATLGTLRLGSLTLGTGADSPLSALDPALVALDPVRDALDAAIGEVEAQFGDAGIFLEAGVLEGRCSVEDGRPLGAANLVGAQVVLRLPDQAGQDDLVLADLPVNPRPNTPIPTDTASTLDAVGDAVRKNFETSFRGELGALGNAVGNQIISQVADAVRKNVQDQLAPIEDNLVSGVLNAQTFPTSDSIRVTALRLDVLPAANQFIGSSVVALEVGDVGCGPADRVAPTEDPTSDAAPPPAAPRLPTAVSAGVAGQVDSGPGAASYAALGLGLAAAGLAGATVARRRLRG